MNNPYLFLLIRELIKHEQIGQVTTGYGWLGEDLKPDIIHLHWPELLVKSSLSDMSRIDLLTSEHFSKITNSLLGFKKKGARIVITIHNEKPHKDKKGQFSDFYSDIYQLADGFIHMGKSSEKLIRKEFENETNHKQSFVIPHGNYKYFPDDMNRDQCRELLNIDPQQKLVLAFGAIRTEKELNLGLDSFLEANLKDTIYMMAGKLPHPYKSQLEHYKARRKLYRHHFDKRIRIAENVIPPKDVQIYLKSADLILIPRFNTLNSGNVALGFTFGKVVAGPNYGVIGEVLNETGNPVFDPSDIHDVSGSIKRGLQFAEEGVGEENQRYALERMRWDQVADKTVQAYKSLLTS